MSCSDTHVLAVVDSSQLEQLLSRIADPAEFLSPHGLRSLSKHHEKHPFVFGNSSVGYEPAEALSKIKGGNSNWRGPVWFPTSFLMIESLRKLEKGFGDGIRVPLKPNTDSKSDLLDEAAYSDTRSREGVGARIGGDVAESAGRLEDPGEDSATTLATLTGVGQRIAEGLIGLFLPDADGYRPIYGPRGTRKAELFARDPFWKELVLFHEYFHGDTGEGLGASHQTGWTGLVASLIDEWRK